MRVKLLTGRCGQGFSNEPGDIIEVDEREARTLIAAGSAESVVETAMVETQTVHRGPGRPRKLETRYA